LHRAIEPHERCCQRDLWQLLERYAQLLHLRWQGKSAWDLSQISIAV
jgi:hypothetical protein